MTPTLALASIIVLAALVCGICLFITIAAYRLTMKKKHAKPA